MKKLRESSDLFTEGGKTTNPTPAMLPYNHQFDSVLDFLKFGNVEIVIWDLVE